MTTSSSTKRTDRRKARPKPKARRGPLSAPISPDTDLTALNRQELEEACGTLEL